MNRSLLLALVAAGSVFSLAGQSKLDLPGSQLLDKMQTAQKAALSRSSDLKVIEPETNAEQKVLVLITLDGSMTVDDLIANGVDVADARANMVLARLTADEMAEFSVSPDVKSMSIGTKVAPLLDKARENTNVTALHSGTNGLDGQVFTGKGVVAGLMDIGLDPNHINFRNGDELRVKRVWSITGENGAVQSYTTPEKIKGFTTDKSSDTHGTHVLGIMAGSYNKKGKHAYVNANGGAQTSTVRNVPYYGVATEAELAVCCGTTERNNLLLATTNISNFAKEMGMPAVMNLSLGNNIGPHDGTDDSTRYLDEVGKEIIVCVSAGNEGGDKVSLQKTFTASDKVVKTFASTTASLSGSVDIWGSDSKMLKVTFAAVEKATGKVLYQYVLDRNTKGESVYITGDYYTAPGYIHNSEFNRLFGNQGALIMNSNINTNNNRYNVYLSLSLKGTASSGVAPAIFVEGESGSTAYIFSGGSTSFESNNVAGYTAGNAECSINGLGCGHNVITVGSYTNRSYWPAFGGMLSYGNNPPAAGAISSFSSYGTTFDGRKLPLIVGPGESVISSISHYYYQGGYIDKPSYVSAEVKEDKRANYWYEMSGTSMSSPFVAGVVALWLQADPTLNVEDVKNIMKETADNDRFTKVQPERWGYGKINALAGVKKILNSAGVADVTVDDNSILISNVGDGAYEIFAAGASSVQADLFTVAGTKAASLSANGETLTIEPSTVAPGLYILNVTAGQKTLSRKLLLR